MTNKPEPNTRPLPQPSELVEPETAHLLLALLDRRSDDALDEFGDPIPDKLCLDAANHITQLEAQIAKLHADGDKLALVLQEAKTAIEHGRLGEQMCCSGHMCGCQGSTNADYLLHCLTQALTEWKDRA